MKIKELKELGYCPFNLGNDDLRNNYIKSEKGRMTLVDSEGNVLVKNFTEYSYSKENEGIITFNNGGFYSALDKHNNLIVKNARIDPKCKKTVFAFLHSPDMLNHFMTSQKIAYCNDAFVYDCITILRTIIEEKAYKGENKPAYEAEKEINSVMYQVLQKLNEEDSDLIATALRILNERVELKA